MTTTNERPMNSMGGATITPLSGLTIGMWKSRKHEHLWILVVPEKEMFVFLVKPWSDAHRVPTQQGGGESRRKTFQKRDAMLKQFGAESPFSFHPSHGRGEGVVFGFEVEWRHVKGVNYSNPLVRQGRLVVEACNVEKKEFSSLNRVKEYYGVLSADGAESSHCRCEGDQNTLEKDILDGTRENLFARLDKVGGGEGSPSLMTSFNAKHDEEDDYEGADSRSFEFCKAEETTILSDGDSNIAQGEDVSSSNTVGPRGFFTSLRRRKTTELSKAENISEAREEVAENTPTHTSSLRIHVPQKGNTFWSEDVDDPSSVRTYPFRTIAAEWVNVHVPCALLPVFEHEERLLKMYESGLPAWSMFLPAYGFYYRPWVRSMTWFLFYLFSVFSLTVGFWDLYKTLPGLQAALSKLVESMWLPPTSVLQWIEEHAQIRLSILLTYLFGKSELFVFVMKNASIWWKNVSIALEPLGRVVAPIVTVVKVSISTMTTTVFVPLKMAISLLFTPFSVVFQTLNHLWSGITALSSVFATALKGFTIGSSAMSFGQGTAATEGWLLVSEAMRASLVKVLRATNSVWKFFINMCNGISRHRITLSRRYKRWRIRFQSSLKVMMMSVFWGIADFFLRLHEKIYPQPKPNPETESSDNTKSSGHEVSQGYASLSFSDAFLSKDERQQLDDTACSTKDT